jgi:DNA repair protein RadC
METINDILKTVTEVELSYKSKVKASQRPKVGGSREAYQLLLTTWDKGTIEFLEQFKVLLLNRAQRVLGLFEVSTGGVTGTVADPKVIFAAALKANACSIILSHNHPSGALTPSQTDIELTKRLRDGGKLLDIQVLDHIIVAVEGYFSFADEGLI